MSASPRSTSSPKPVTPAEPVAVVGLSCLFPEAASAEEFWSNVRRGVDCIREIPPTHWNVDDYFNADPKSPDMTYARRGGFLKTVGFDALEFGISPNNLEAIDTAQLLGLVAAKRALEHAGYGSDRDFDRTRVSCILGVTGTLEMVVPLGARLGHPHWRRALEEAGVAPDVADDVVNRISASYVPWQENSFPGLLGNVVAGRIANKLDLWGTNCVVDAACASSLSALHLAVMELQAGRSDMVLTGGVDTFNDIFMYMCFSKTPALSPTGDARPFSQQSDGTMLGEGVGLVVLKRLADAQRDGDKIFGVIRSVGTASDGKGTAVYAPKAEGQIRCLEDAYRNAGVSPTELDLVEAHGTGTKVGDATEIKGLTHVFEVARAKTPRSAGSPWCAVGSVKSQIGHTKAAAGIASLIKVILALHHEVLPPTIKVEEPADAFRQANSPFYVNAKSRPWLPPAGRARRAGVSAFGFGGSNFHCVLEEAQPASRPPRVPAWDGSVQILPFSAPDVTSLILRVDEFLQKASSPENRLRVVAANLRDEFRPSDFCRLAIVAEIHDDGWKNLASRAIEQLRRTSSSLPSRSSPNVDVQWSLPDGVVYSQGASNGSIGLLFPGQGSQSPGMLRDLACLFPEMRDVLAAANAAFVDFRRDVPSHETGALTDFIYPVSNWSEADRQENIGRLRATDVAQPALGAVSLGGWRILQRFGVRPDAVAGHSYGELTALCAAGRFSPEELYRLSLLRGQLMAQSDSQPGGMLAISASSEVVEQALRELNLELVIANHNSPSQVVISGRIDHITRAGELLGKRNLRGKQLAVAAAFHSPLVAQATQKFRPALERISFVDGTLPVYANSSASLYPQEPAAARDLLAKQLAQPVHFVAEIEAMYRSGIRTFIEVGPGQVLTGLVSSILNGKPHRACALDSSQGRRRGEWDLAWLLGQLAVAGHEVRLTAWDSPTIWSDHHQAQPKGPTIPLSGANYVKPKPPLPKRVVSSSPVVPAKEAAPSSLASVPAMTISTTSSDAVTIASTPTPIFPDLIKDSSPVASYLETLQAIQLQTASAHQAFLAQQQQALNLLAQMMHGGASLPLANASPVAVSPPLITPAPVVAPAQVPAPAPVPAAPVMQAVAAPVSPPALTQGFHQANGQHAADRTASRVAVSSPPPAPSPTTAISAPLTGLAATLLKVVSEKTGYPAEMLALRMSLDHDLGIDSIKRVEILSAMQERFPNLPVVSPEQLGSLQTLADVVAAFPDMSSMGSSASAIVAPSLSGAVVKTVAATVAATTTATEAPTGLAAVLLQVVSEKTGYPAEMLQLRMSLDHDLGIDSIKRVEILSAMQDRFPNLPVVSPEQLGSLQTLADVVAAYPTADAPVVAASTPVVPTPTSPASLPDSASEGLARTLLEVVAEKTGYPAEMLQLRMSLDHDLGIDSIKRVEILSAMQERFPNLPVVSPELLGSLQTLADVVAAFPQATSSFSDSGDVKKKSSSGDDSTLASTPVNTLSPVSFPAGHALKRGLLTIRPLAPAQERVAATSVRQDVWITDDGMGAEGLSQQVAQVLQGRGISARVVPATASTANLPPTLGGLIVIPPAKESLSTNDLWEGLAWLQAVSAPFRTGLLPGERRLLVGVVRLNGHFGVSTQGDAQATIRQPVSGGIAGLIKTAQHEWPEVVARVFDIGTLDSMTAARKLVEELLADGPVETGLGQDGTSGAVGIDVEWVPLEAEHEARCGGACLGAGDVVLVSGGARGVTMEAALALGRALGTTMVLMGRTPTPVNSIGETSASTRFTEAELRQRVLAEKRLDMTPRWVADEVKRLLAEQELTANLARFAAAGVKAIYRQADVTDPDSVRRVIGEVTSHFGPVRGLIHGAGVIADARIEKKTRAQFEDVTRVKVGGLENLLAAIDPRELKMLGLFSSFTGRYGRVGQVDYAIANEVLNKQARAWASMHPHCQVGSFNWGPWDGGMVNDHLRQIFAKEQVGLIPLAEGAALFASEFCQSNFRPVEIIVLAEPQIIDPASTQEVESPISASAAQVTVSRSEARADEPAAGGSRLGFERRLRIDGHPFLEDHVIGGKAVLPLAMMLEWMAQGATHLAAGMVLRGFEEVKVLKGVRLGVDDVADLQVRMAPAPTTDRSGSQHGGASRWLARITSGTGGKSLLHATAIVRLGDSISQDKEIGTRWERSGIRTIPDAEMTPSSLYEGRLFHGPLLQGIEQVSHCYAHGITLATRLADAPRQWMREPHRHAWLLDPLVMDAVFQSAILWAWQQRGMPSLPTGIARIELFARRFPAEGVTIEAVVRKATAHVVSMDVELRDRRGGLVAMIEGFESLMDASLREAFMAKRLRGGHLIER